MSDHFSIRQAFLYFSHERLKEYFDASNNPLALDWGVIDDKDPAPLIHAWQALPDNMQLKSEQDLQDAWTLGNENGIQSLQSIAEQLGCPFLPEVESIESALDRALWVCSNRAEVWNQMGDFLPVDKLTNRRMWRRYPDLEPIAIDEPDGKADALAAEISEYFRIEDGYINRHYGEHHVKPSSTENYFPVYINAGVDPNPVLTEDNRLQKDLRRKLGVIAFVYSPNKGHLRVYVERNAKIARQLYEIFHKVIFGKPAPPDDTRKTAYRLNRVLSDDFRLTVPGIHEVSDIAVTQMRVRPRFNMNRSFDLRGDTRNMGKADTVKMVDDGLNPNHYPRHLLEVDRIEIRADLRPGRPDKKKSLTFDVCWPNGGNLHNQPEPLQRIGEKILQQWNIDTQPLDAPEAWEDFLSTINAGVTIIGRSTVDKWPDGMLQLLLQEGVLIPADSARTCDCMWCDGTHDVEERTGPDGEAHDYMFCLIANKPILVRPERIQQWEVSHLPLIKRVAATLRIGGQPREVVAGCAWRLGMSQFPDLDRPVYYAMSGARQHLSEGNRVFDDHAIVLVPSEPWQAPGLEARGIRFVPVIEVLYYSQSGYASDPSPVFDVLGIPKPQRESLLKPWYFTLPCTVNVVGQEYDAVKLANQDKNILGITSGRLSVPLTELFQKNGSAVWKERLSGNKGTDEQRRKVSSALHRVNQKLGKAGIPMVLELPDRAEDIVVTLLTHDPQAVTGAR